MGRWGYLMFQGDDDTEAVLDVQRHIGVDILPQETGMGIFMAGRPSSIGGEHRYLTRHPEYAFKNLVFENLVAVKNMLDGGLTDTVMTKILVEPLMVHQHEFIFGAIIMLSGAKMPEAVRSQLKDSLKKTTILYGPKLNPLEGEGRIRKPASEQFKAALDSYVDGVPHDFYQPCCWGCGKVRGQVENNFSQCQKCVAGIEKSRAYLISVYCNRECQRADWTNHKLYCGKPSMVLNV